MNRNVKKAGLVVTGVVAALVAVSPVAFATDAPQAGPGKACSFQGGDGGAASDISGGALANIVAQAPIAGNNIANIGNCSDFLNNNLNDNLSGNAIDLL